MAAAVTPARRAISFRVAPSNPDSAHAAAAASRSRAAVSCPSELGGRPRRLFRSDAAGVRLTRQSVARRHCIMNGQSFMFCAVASRGAVAEGTTFVELRDIEFAYGPVQVLFGVSFSVARGEVLGLLGTNGAGKSTVLRVLAGLEVPATGPVTFDGRDVTGVPSEKLCPAGVGLVM